MLSRVSFHKIKAGSPAKIERIWIENTRPAAKARIADNILAPLLHEVVNINSYEPSTRSVLWEIKGMFFLQKSGEIILWKEMISKIKEDHSANNEYLWEYIENDCIKGGNEGDQLKRAMADMILHYDWENILCDRNHHNIFAAVEKLAKQDRNLADETIMQLFRHEDKCETVELFVDEIKDIASRYDMNATLDKCQEILWERMILEIIRNPSIHNQHLWEYVYTSEKDNYIDEGNLLKHALAKIILENYGRYMYRSIFDIVEKLAEQDPGFADETMMWLLAKDYEYFAMHIDKIKDIASRYDMSATIEICEEISTIEHMDRDDDGYVEHITNAIVENVLKAYGIRSSFLCRSSSSNYGYYGSVTMGMEMSLSLTMKLTLSMLLKRFSDEVDIEDAFGSYEEKLLALNFLVHHEVAHIIQEHNKRALPKIERYEYLQYLDPSQAKYQANEVAVDAIGFSAARDIYIFSHPGIHLLEYLGGNHGNLETALLAYYVFGINILRDIREKGYSWGDEFICRMAAVSCEMASWARGPMADNFLELSTSFKSLITEKDPSPKNKEIDNLIEEYQQIFRSVTFRHF